MAAIEIVPGCVPVLGPVTGLYVTAAEATDALGGGDVVVTFSENVDDNSIEEGSLAFKVRRAGVDIGYFKTGGSVDPNQLRLHADLITIVTGDVITLDYVPGSVASLDGQFLRAFTGFPVVNNT